MRPEHLVVFADTLARAKPVKKWLGKPWHHHAMERPIGIRLVILESDGAIAPCGRYRTGTSVSDPSAPC